MLHFGYSAMVALRTDSEIQMIAKLSISTKRLVDWYRCRTNSDVHTVKWLFWEQIVIIRFDYTDQ